MNEPVKERKKPGPKPKVIAEARYVQVVEPSAAERAQAYADRVWAGQSPDAPRAWRVERVRLALEGQGMTMEGVVLP